jgi:5-keto 4-deoxyuronate isomerase
MKIRQLMHDNSRRSFVFFFALEEDTTLRILGHDGKIVTVKVKVGEALVASGFLIHSGDGK